MQKIIAANWKMYKNSKEAASEASALASALANGTPDNRLVLVFAPFTAVAAVSAAFAGKACLGSGGQNFYPAAEGAFTGEIAPAMLKDAGATWLLAGHSERRHILGESNDFVAQKVAYGLDQGFSVMLCVGETLAEREAGKLGQVLAEQISSALKPLSAQCKAALAGRFAVAYEPVWAIGTGKVAGHPEVLEAHKTVRDLLVAELGDQGNALPILYGGSVKPDNASGLVNLENVDGLLVGGASLKSESFLKIVSA